ncbi:MAG: P1 family peptidase [Lachnospiraceae bacterium]|nr:P1 family peptidase [Lachnospiraceae bacterium]
MKEINIMEVGGFKVGHAQNMEAATGCTVMLFDRVAPAGVDVRGGGPASRETPLLNPVSDAKGIHALVLSGGSAFGLDAAGGVMKYLEERDIGFDVGVTKVPLVCQSSLFDLVIGRCDVRPDQAMAYAACEAASYDAMEEGNVGAGCGCTVGKYRGVDFCMKSGIGSYAVQAGDLKVGAIVAVNALGDVYDLETGEEIAGLRTPEGGLRSTEEEMWNDVDNMHDLFTGNTTIGMVVTNAAMDKALLNKVASMAHNGYARTIRPVHTTADGDSIYAVSTGDLQGDVNIVGTLAAYVMGKAINQAVRTAKGMCGFPAAVDLKK